MNLEQTMISQATKVGADWAGMGAVSGPDLLTMLQAGKIRGAFMDNAILVEITKENGEIGVYQVAEASVAEKFL